MNGELGDRGYLTVLSDVDSKDWETSLSVEQMFANATPDGSGGATRWEARRRKE